MALLSGAWCATSNGGEGALQSLGSPVLSAAMRTEKVVRAEALLVRRTDSHPSTYFYAKPLSTDDVGGDHGREGGRGGTSRGYFCR